MYTTIIMRPFINVRRKAKWPTLSECLRVSAYVITTKDLFISNSQLVQYFNIFYFRNRKVKLY